MSDHYHAVLQEIIFVVFHAVSTQVLAASANTTIARGDTATLTCVSYVQPNLEITWLFNGAPVEYSSLVVSNMVDVTGTGDMIPLRQSFLHICAASVNVSGTYSCVVSNGLTSDEHAMELTVTCKHVGVCNHVFLCEKLLLVPYSNVVMFVLA